MLTTIQQQAKDELAFAGLSLPPFWSFIGYNGSEQFKFFYLNEGDDPPVYYYLDDKHTTTDGVEEYIIKESDTFSGFIDKAVERAIADQDNIE